MGYIYVWYAVGIYSPIYQLYIMKLKAKLTTMGDKYIIIIPKLYHKEAKPLKGDVNLEITKA